MGKRKFDDKTMREIQRDYEYTNMFIREICEKYDIYSQTLYLWIHKFNWKRYADLRHYSLDVLSAKDIKAKELYEHTEMGLLEIARKENISSGRLSKLKRKYNWIKDEQYITRHKELSEHLLNSIYEDYRDDKLTCNEICNKYNISIATLFRWAEKYGWEKRNKPVLSKSTRKRKKTENIQLKYEQAKQLYETTNLSQRQIAFKVGLNPVTLNQKKLKENWIRQIDL